MADKTLNEVFQYTDAIEVLEEILNQTREERDVYDYNKSTGTYGSWDAYHKVQKRVEVLEDTLQALTEENSVRHYIRKSAERED